MSLSSFKNWKFSLPLKVHYFQADMSSPDGFAHGAPVITVLSPCKPCICWSLTDWGLSAVLVSEKLCPESHSHKPNNAEGPEKSWPWETSVAGYFFHKTEYITPALVSKHASTTVFSASGRQRLRTQVSGSLSHSQNSKDSNPDLSRDSLKSWMDNNE